MEALALCVAVLSFSSSSSSSSSGAGSHSQSPSSLKQRFKSGSSSSASDSPASILSEALAIGNLLRTRRSGAATAATDGEEDGALALMLDLPERLSSPRVALFLPQVCCSRFNKSPFLSRLIVVPRIVPFSYL